MSARKLQQEFDKTNKKVAEGLAIFDDIYDKLMTTEISSQKEKFESDLKKEIKKLQRARDQLKQWLGDTSIKLDKNLLQENRTKIEHAMDQFKDLEKLSKIKQFSNEGLELQSKRSRMKAAPGQDNEKKAEACNYISDIIEQISGQSELLESDIHHFTVQLKKAKSSAAHTLQTSIDDARYKVERNNEHLARLENILDNLDNDTLNPDKIDLIKDDLEYYVDNNQDEDYVEYDEFYEQLEMAAPEAAAEDDEETQPVEKEDQERLEREKAEKEKAENAEKERLERERIEKEKEEAKRKEKAEKAKKKTTTITTPVAAPSSIQSKPAYTNGTKSSIIGAVAPAPPVNAYASGTTLAEVVAGANGVAPSKVPPPGLTKIVSKSSTASPIIAQAHLDRKAQTPSLSSQTEENGADSSIFALSIARLHNITQSRLANPLPFQSISQALENSLFNCPDSFDADKPRQYAPTNVHPSSIDYPQEPMYELNASHLMSKFDNDTLFYCFYYGEHDYRAAKINAARELSKRGWVFNTDTKQWFLRDTKSDEQGENYKYFDYEKTWLLRRKVNYNFAPELQETV